MAVISTFSEIDKALCAVTLYEDKDPVMVHVSINNSRPLQLTVSEAVAVCEALEEALNFYLDLGDDEETVH